jgi:hypothetical protein
VATADLPSKAVPTDPNELQKLLERAQRGDEKTLPALRELLNKPHIVEACGDLAAHAENALIRKLSGKDLALSEGLRRKLGALRAELAGPTPTPLERMLVGRVVACWLHLYHLEAVYAGQDGMSLELAQHYQKCTDRAHKRYLSAIKTLALVRRLALPVLVQQVNVAAKQQVNVGR